MKDNMNSPYAPTKITEELLKKSEMLKCQCGGMIFRHSYVFKKISMIISPTGKEELMPIEVMVCEKCNKINRSLMSGDILPPEIMEDKLVKL